MGQDHLELVLKLRPNGNRSRVRSYFEDRGLPLMTMASGFLLSGSQEQLAKALQTSPGKLAPPADVPVPDDLAQDVELVTVPRPRSYHA